MQFETLKRSHLKRNIIIGVVIVAIISAIILNFTRAKYRVTQSIPLVNGTINYSPGDIIISAYFNGELLEKFPAKEDGYIVENVTCDKEASAIFNENDWELEVTNLVTKGTKCDVYFEEKIAQNYILANYSTVKTRTFPLTTSSTVTGNTTGVIYKSANSNQYDNDGEVYYFAGNPTDNWVKWAGFYWRIIRINGNGSIRMIYQGTSANTTGTNTQLQTSAFNSSYDRSEYVGLKYTEGEQHGQNTNSTIMGVLETWYNNNLSNYADDIDINVGFCSDRNMGSGDSWSSLPSGNIYYAAYDRVAKTSSNVNPSYKCSNSSDLLKIPVGLITVDETVYAGLAWSSNNSSNYLYTGQDYWTMSPNRFSPGNAYVFRVWPNGLLVSDWVKNALGVRPVINLKADVKLIGTGTTSDPYRIEGAE